MCHLAVSKSSRAVSVLSRSHEAAAGRGHHKEVETRASLEILLLMIEILHHLIQTLIHTHIYIILHIIYYILYTTYYILYTIL